MTSPPATCLGCGHPLPPGYGDDCPRCEYFNLVSGRYHYCGADTCYCRALRRTIRPEVLAVFADQFRQRAEP